MIHVLSTVMKAILMPKFSVNHQEHAERRKDSNSLLRGALKFFLFLFTDSTYNKIEKD